MNVGKILARFRPVDTVHVVGFGSAAVLLLVFPASQIAWIYAVICTLVMGIPFCAWAAAGDEPVGWARLLLSFYPLLGLVLLFMTLAEIQIVWPPEHFDELLMRWDEKIFGFQPGVEWKERYPQPWLGELMSFCYVTFYSQGPLLVLLLLVRKQIGEVDRFLFFMLFGFQMHFLFFVLFPSGGPQFFDARMGGVEAVPGYFFSDLRLEVSHRFDRAVAAFPSSHVAMAVVAAVYSWRVRALRPLFTLLAVGIFFAVTYVGAHYFVDAPAGVASGLVCYWLAGRVYDRRMSSTPNFNDPSPVG